MAARGATSRCEGHCSGDSGRGTPPELAGEDACVTILRGRRFQEPLSEASILKGIFFMVIKVIKAIKVIFSVTLTFGRMNFDCEVAFGDWFD